MRRIILSSVACLDLPYFLTLPRKRDDFRGQKFIGPKLFILIFHKNLSEIYLILRRMKADIILDIYWYSCKLSVILVRF